jgi:hypothetical protein
MLALPAAVVDSALVRPEPVLVVLVVPVVRAVWAQQLVLVDQADLVVLAQQRVLVVQVPS